jgi:hypothetical protein
MSVLLCLSDVCVILYRERMSDGVVEAAGA